MIIYLTKTQAVISMHERGFIDDFQLFGDNLLWVQHKIFIRPADFIIIEYHRFSRSFKKGSDDILFGVVIINTQVKGILLNHYSCYTLSTPAIIRRKLQEMNHEYHQY